MNFWVTQTDHKTYSLRAPSGQDGSVGKDSWIQVWQGELDPQYPRGRRAEGLSQMSSYLFMYTAICMHSPLQNK